MKEAVNEHSRDDRKALVEEEGQPYGARCTLPCSFAKLPILGGSLALVESVRQARKRLSHA
jgi:hypothetical protein